MLKRDRDDQGASTSKTVEVDQPPRKKLVLRTPSLSVSQASALVASSAFQKLRKLNQISKLAQSGQPIVKAGAAADFPLDKLSESDELLRVSTLNSLSAKIDSDDEPRLSISEILATYKKADTTTEQVSALRLLCSILTKNTTTQADIDQVSSVANQNLKSISHIRRCTGVQVLTALVLQLAKQSSPKIDSMRDIVIEFIGDPHPKVRTTALNSVIAFLQKGAPLQVKILQKASESLNDDDESVRMASLNLITTAALHAPTSQRVNLSETGFQQVCERICDVSPQVRQVAASLLKSFTEISDSLLAQTLDKMIMSNMRRKQGARDRPRELLSYQFEQTLTSRQFEMEAETEIQLTNVGAFGAFVDGLEDELMEVRLSTLQSLIEHAKRRPQFALQCQDYVIDMFNDEIEEVRLAAIMSLCEIAEQLSIQDDQIEMITSVLKDSRGEIRAGLHQLIGKLKYSSHVGLDQVITGLLENLKRYPHDISTIIEAMKSLGSRSAHTELLVDGLLNTCSMFDTAEPNLEDKAYILVMVFIFNAAARNPAIVSILPNFCSQHFRHMKSAYPALVPTVHALSDY